jgi:BirA family biotin operon repressor/biotin-[acetyl-CoA-carboxylase] ligase
VRLGASAAARGFRLLDDDTVVSTNDLAMSRARDGDAGPLWVVAASQTGGRGRLGRVWSSPPGNLYASLLLVDPAPAAVIPQLGFVTGVALMRACEALGVPRGSMALKWPNDALLDGAKVSGVLMEATTTTAGRLACVIGIGVNCVAHPDGLSYPATNLDAHGYPIAREALFEALSDAMARELEVWNAGAGFPTIRRGATLEVVSGERTLRGIFETIDADGRLILATSSGVVAVDAGDVLLPAQSSSPRDVRQGKQ